MLRIVKSGELRGKGVTRALGGIFLLHFPSARAAQALPGTVPCGARTFLGIPKDDATVWPTPPWALSHMGSTHTSVDSLRVLADRDQGSGHP